MGGKHRMWENDPWHRRVVLWCCSEGKHVLIELPAGLGAILLYEFFLSPHGAENLHYITDMFSV